MPQVHASIVVPGVNVFKTALRPLEKGTCILNRDHTRPGCKTPKHFDGFFIKNSEFGSKSVLATRWLVVFSTAKPASLSATADSFPSVYDFRFGFVCRLRSPPLFPVNL